MTRIHQRSVGRLLVATRWRTPGLKEPGQMIMDGHVLSAEQGLKEIRDLTQSF